MTGSPLAQLYSFLAARSSLTLTTQGLAAAPVALPDVSTLLAAVPGVSATTPVMLTSVQVEQSAVVYATGVATGTVAGTQGCAVDLVFSMEAGGAIGLQVTFHAASLTAAFPNIANDPEAVSLLGTGVTKTRLVVSSFAGTASDGAPLAEGLNLRFDYAIPTAKTAYHPIGSLVGSVLTAAVPLHFCGPVSDPTAPTFYLGAIVASSVSLPIFDAQVDSLAFFYSRTESASESAPVNTIALAIVLEVFGGNLIAATATLPNTAAAGTTPALLLNASADPPLALPSLSSVASLVGGADLLSGLPPEMSSVGKDLGLRSASLMFDPGAMKVVFASVTIGASPALQVIPGSSFLEVESWSITFLVTPGASPEVSITCEGLIGLTTDAALDFTLGLPSFVIAAALTEARPAPPALMVGDLLSQTFHLEAPPEIEKLTITDLDLGAAPREGWWTLALGIADPSFPPILGVQLESLGFSVQYAQGALTVDVTGQFAPAWTHTAVFQIGGSHSPDGWSLSGALQGTLDVGTVANGLLGVASVDAAFADFSLENVSFDLTRSASAGNSYAFSGELALTTGFSLFGVSFDDPALKLSLQKQETTSSGSIDGSISINAHVFDVSYAMTAGTPSSETIALSYDGYSAVVAEQTAPAPGITATISFPAERLGALLSYLVHKLDPGLPADLGAPWNVLFDIELPAVQIVFTFDGQHKLQSAKVTPAITSPVDFGFVTVSAVDFSIDFPARTTAFQVSGTFLGRPVTGLTWDPVNGDPPAVPGAGSSLIDVRCLALGQHYAFTSTPTSVTGAIAALRTAVASGGTDSGATMPALTGIGYAATADWLIAADMTLLGTVTLGAVFQDPDLYGLLIQLGGPRAKALAGLSFEVLYRRISADIGEYSLVLTLPDAMRHIQLGEVALTLPTIELDVYTNGNFYVDLGFPRGGDFSNSFQVEVLPFLGAGGFYFGMMDGQTSRYVPAISNGRFSPVIELGVGLQVGVGKTFQAGPLSAGAELTLQGILQGVLGFFHPDDASTPHEDYFQFQGSVALVAKIWGRIDLAIISASLSATAYAAIMLAAESHQPIHITASFGVEVDVSVRVLFIHVHFHQTFHLTAEFTVGHASPTPWTVVHPAAALPSAMPQLASGPAPSSTMAAGVYLELGGGIPAAPAPATFTWTPAANFAWFASPAPVPVYFAPNLAQTESGTSSFVAQLFVENGFGTTATPPFDALASAMLAWALATWTQAATADALSAALVGYGDLLLVDELLSGTLTGDGVAVWLNRQGTTIGRDDAAAIVQELEAGGVISGSGRVLGTTASLSAAYAPYQAGVSALLAWWSAAWAPGQLFTLAALKTFLATNFSFTVQPAAGPLTGSVFPMFEELVLSRGTKTVDFSVPPPSSYVDALNLWIAEMYSGTQAPPATLAGGESLTGWLFHDYFILLQRSVVQAARRLLKAWRYTATGAETPAGVVTTCCSIAVPTAADVGALFAANQAAPGILSTTTPLTVGTAAYTPAAGDTLASIAQAYQCSIADLAGANAGVASIFVKGAVLEVPSALVPVQALMGALSGQKTAGDPAPHFSDAAAAVSRFFLHGTQLPDPADTATVTATSLYRAARQQLEMGGDGDPVALAVGATNALGVQLGATSFPFTPDQLALVAAWPVPPNAPNPPTAQRAYISGPRQFALGQSIAWSGAPSDLAWASPPALSAAGTQPRIWPFPTPLTNALAAGSLALTPTTSAARPSGTTSSQPLAGYAWATMLSFRVRTTNVAGVYAVVQLDTATADALRGLATTSIDKVYLLFGSSAAQGAPALCSDSGATALLVRTRAKATGPIPASADLASKPAAFLQLLGFAAAEGNAGVLLHYESAAHPSGLPSYDFGSRNDAELRLLCISKDVTTVGSHRNCLVTQGAIDPRTMLLHVEAGGVLAAHAVLGAGRAGIDWTIPAPGVLDVTSNMVPDGFKSMGSGPVPTKFPPEPATKDANGVTKGATQIVIPDTTGGWGGMYVQLDASTTVPPTFRLTFWVLPDAGSVGKQIRVAGGGTSSPTLTVTLPATQLWTEVSLIVTGSAPTQPMAISVVGEPAFTFYLASDPGDILCIDDVAAAFQLAGVTFGTSAGKVRMPPSGPLKPQAGTTAAPVPKGSLRFDQAIDLTLLAAAGASSSATTAPPPAQNPYALVGTTLQVEAELRDLYGNPSPTPQPLGLPIVYTDPLLPCDHWPGCQARYEIGGGAAAPALTIGFGLDVSRYLPTPQRSFATQLRRAEKDRAAWATIYYQLSDPNVAASLVTSAGTVASDTTLAAKLATYAAAVWSFLGALDGALAEVTVSGAASLSALESGHGIRLEEIAAANARVPAVFAASMAVPVFGAVPAGTVPATLAGLGEAAELATLAELNGATPNLLQPGVAVTHAGVTHTIAAGETLRDVGAALGLSDPIDVAKLLEAGAGYIRPNAAYVASTITGSQTQTQSLADASTAVSASVACLAWLNRETRLAGGLALTIPRLLTLAAANLPASASVAVPAGASPVAPSSLKAAACDLPALFGANMYVGGVVAAGATVTLTPPGSTTAISTTTTAAPGTLDALWAPFRAAVGDLAQFVALVSGQAFLAPGTTLLAPPASIQASGAITAPASASIVKLTAGVAITRSAALPTPGDLIDDPTLGAALAAAVASATAAVAPLASPNEHGARSLTAFAKGFEAALPGMKVASSKDENGERTLWSIPFAGSSLAVAVDATLAPRFFTPLPLANLALSREGVMIADYVAGTGLGAPRATNVAGADLDALANAFFELFDGALTPAVSPRIAAQDAASYASLVAAKETIGAAVASMVASVFVANDPGPTLAARQRSAAAALQAQLADRLGSAYAVDTVVQLGLAVTNGLQGGDAAAVSLLGKASPASGSLGPMSLTTAEVSLLGGTAWLNTMLVSAKDQDTTAPTAPSVSASLAYAVTGMRILPTGAPAGDEVQAVFVVPPAGYALGTLQIPIVLRAVPVAPTVLSQTGTATVAAPADLAQARQWDYTFEYQTHQEQPQDTIQALLRFNEPPGASPSQPAAAGSTGAVTASDDLFAVLAQLQHVAPALAAALHAPAGAAIPACAITAFAALATRAATAFQVWHEVVSAGDAARDAYVFTIGTAGATPVGAAPPFAVTVAAAAADPTKASVSAAAAADPTKASVSAAAAADPTKTSVSAAALDVLRYQNAWASVRQLRNASFGIAGATTDGRFVYRTPEVRFASRFVPSLVVTAKLEFDAGGDLRADLAALFGELLDSGPTAGNPSLFHFKFACSYRFALGGSVEVNVPVLMRPQHLFAPRDALEAPTAFVTQLAAELEGWVAGRNPAPGGTFVLDVTLYDNADLPSTVDKLCNFLARNNTGNRRGMTAPTAMPLSFYAEPEYWAENPQAEDAVDAMTERLNVHFGADIYDVATMQIALALRPGFEEGQEICSAWTRRLLSMQSGALANICGGGKAYKYGDADQVFTVSPANPCPGYFFRSISDQYCFTDPYTGAFVYPGGQEFDGIASLHWLDWKPITGENAWAALLGPLHFEIRRRGGMPPLTSDGVQLALRTIPAFRAMQHTGHTPGGLYYAPAGTAANVNGQVDPKFLSHENNASSLAGLVLLHQVLTGGPEAAAPDDIAAVAGLVTGVRAHLEAHFYDPDTGYLTTGGTFVGSGAGTFVSGGAMVTYDAATATARVAALNEYANLPAAADVGVAVWGPDPSCPAFGAKQSVTGASPTWTILDYVNASDLAPTEKYVAFQADDGSLTFYGIPFAVDVHTWGMTVLGVDVFDGWFGTQTFPGTSTQVSVYQMWQRVKARAGYFENGDVTKAILGVGYSDVPGGDHQSVLSAEWTFGAITLCRAAAAQYGAKGNTAWAASLAADAESMLHGLRCLMLDASRDDDDLAAYYYTNRRYWIPFGWWGNRIDSLCSTAWGVMVELGFNPFDVAGSYARAPGSWKADGTDDTSQLPRAGGAPTRLLGAMSAAGVGGARQKRLAFLLRNDSFHRGFPAPSGMALSFYAPPSFYSDPPPVSGPPGPTPVPGHTERTMIQYGLDIYDAATMQIALAMYPSLSEAVACAERQTIRLLSGSAFEQWWIRGWTDPAHPTTFFYGLGQAAVLPPPHPRAAVRHLVLTSTSPFGAATVTGPDKPSLSSTPLDDPDDWQAYVGPVEVALERDKAGGGAYFFRSITDQNPFALPDPADASAKPIKWQDWKPITGENAWACLLGPLQTAFAALGALPPLGHPAVQLALSVVPALQLMAIPSGGLLYAPWNTAGNEAGSMADPTMLSIENNASSLSGLRMLRAVLSAQKDTEHLPAVQGLITGIEAFFRDSVLNPATGTFHSSVVWDDAFGAPLPGALAAQISGSAAATSAVTLAALAKGDTSDGGLASVFAAFGISSNLPAAGSPVVAGFAPGGWSRWDLDGYTIVYPSGGGTMRLFTHPPFAVDVHTWGMTVLGAAAIDGWFGTNRYAGATPPITVHDIWARVKAKAGFTVNGSLAGVGYTDAVNAVLSAEWTFGAITLCRAAAAYYAGQNNDAAAQALQGDADSMATGVRTLMLDTSRSAQGLEAYLYTNVRYWIPFGWYGNPVDSLCSTAWSLMVDEGFNPFELGGGYGPDTVTYRPNPRTDRVVRPILRTSNLHVPTS